MFHHLNIVVVQLLSHVWLFATPWTAAHQASLSLTFSEFAQVHVHWIGDAIQHLILCCPLRLLPSIFPSIRVFSNESVLCIRWTKIIGASVLASVLPMNIQDWFPLGLTSLIPLQSKGLSKVSNTTVQKYQFFGTQLSLWSNSDIQTTGKTIALTMWNFVGKVMSLFFNTLCRFVIAFLPRSMHLLIGSVNLQVFQMLTYFILQKQKQSVVNISTNFIRKNQVSGNCQA